MRLHRRRAVVEEEGGPPRWSGAAALRLLRRRVSGERVNCPVPEREELRPSCRSNLGASLTGPCGLIRTVDEVLKGKWPAALVRRDGPKC